jgi:aryl carrier-like protein
MTHPEGAESADRPVRIEAMLARYPQVEAVELSELKHWFRKEASALDVGTIASNPVLAEPYRRFAAEHIEKLTIGDIARAAGLAALALGVIAGLVLMAS